MPTPQHPAPGTSRPFPATRSLPARELAMSRDQPSVCTRGFLHVWGTPALVGVPLRDVLSSVLRPGSPQPLIGCSPHSTPVKYSPPIRGTTDVHHCCHPSSVLAAAVGVLLSHSHSTARHKGILWAESAQPLSLPAPRRSFPCLSSSTYISSNIFIPVADLSRS